jgi:multidrug efflux pump subunit AcrB
LRPSWKRWPETIKVDFTYDESEFINRGLVVLESGLITATMLVMVIIIASLGLRQGIMVGLAIPLCFMIAFLLLQAFGMTLNQMVMFGLVLAVGILVDGGIVVVEYADRKHGRGHAQGGGLRRRRETHVLAGGQRHPHDAVRLHPVPVLELDRRASS